GEHFEDVVFGTSGIGVGTEGGVLLPAILPALLDFLGVVVGQCDLLEMALARRTARSRDSRARAVRDRRGLKAGDPPRRAALPCDDFGAGGGARPRSDQRVRTLRRSSPGRSMGVSRRKARAGLRRRG